MRVSKSERRQGGREGYQQAYIRTIALQGPAQAQDQDKHRVLSSPSTSMHTVSMAAE